MQFIIGEATEIVVLVYFETHSNNSINDLIRETGLFENRLQQRDQWCRQQGAPPARKENTYKRLHFFIIN